MWGTLGAILPELFPADVRATGASLGYQLGSIVAGFGPAIAASVVVATGGTLGVSFAVTGAALISIIAISVSRETSKGALKGSLPAQATEVSVPASIA
jgi:hypothetical protein